MSLQNNLNRFTSWIKMNKVATAIIVILVIVIIVLTTKKEHLTEPTTTKSKSKKELIKQIYNNIDKNPEEYEITLNLTNSGGWYCIKKKSRRDKKNSKKI